MTDQIDELSNSTLQSVAKKRADQSKEAGGVGVNNPTRAKAMDLLRKSDNAKYRHTEHPSKVTPKTPAPAPTEADKAAHAKANKAKVDSQNNRGYGEGRYMGDSVEQTEVEDQLDEAHKLGDKVEVVKGSGKGTKGTIGEIRHGLFKGAPKTYTVYHGESGAIQVPKEHIRKCSEEVESVTELSMDTVKSYKEKVVKNPAPSKTTSNILHKAIRRFAGKERAEDRIHSDEMKKMRERLGLKNEEVLEEAAVPKGHTIEAQGVRGMDSKPWRKTFKNHEHLSKWADENDSIEVHGTRDLDQAKRGNLSPAMKNEEVLDENDGIHIGARVYHKEHQSGEPHKVTGIVDDQRVKVKDEHGNSKVMFIKQLTPAKMNEEVITEGAGIGDLVKFHKIAGMNGHRYAQISGFVMSKKDGRIDPMTGRVHGTATHYVAKLKKDPLNTVNFTPDVHIPVGDVHKVDQYDEIQNHKMRMKVLGKIKGESVETNESFIRYDHHSVNFLSPDKGSVPAIKSGKLVSAQWKHKDEKSNLWIDGYASPADVKKGKDSDGHSLRSPIKEETLSEDAAQKNMTNAMDSIDPIKRDAARKQYKAARDTGMNHASSLTLMHQRFGKTNEEVDEEVKTEKPQHKVGDTVWATSPTNKALTMTGKVTKIGQTLTTVQHKDGSEAHYPHKLVNNDYEVLHPNPKKWQREHLELTGELLTLTEVKYILENANGGVGVIAKHAGVDGAGPQGTGKVKKMMGNKTDAAAIAKIIVNGAKSKEERN